jgi:hypothetical protein
MLNLLRDPVPCSHFHAVFRGSDRGSADRRVERGMPSKGTLGLRVGSTHATIARGATHPPRKFASTSVIKNGDERP